MTKYARNISISSSKRRTFTTRRRSLKTRNWANIFQFRRCWSFWIVSIDSWRVLLMTEANEFEDSFSSTRTSRRFCARIRMSSWWIAHTKSTDIACLCLLSWVTFHSIRVFTSISRFWSRRRRRISSEFLNNWKNYIDCWVWRIFE